MTATVDYIYRAIEEPELWVHFPDYFAALIPECRAAAYGIENFITNEFSMESTVGLSPEWVEDYVNYWHRNNLWMKANFAYLFSLPLQ